MSTPSSMRSPTPQNQSRRSPQSRSAAAGASLAAALFAALAPLAASPAPAAAQQIVYDPRNQVQNALQAARQLESLANEARQLANEARMLAASPYSHLAESSRTLQDVGELARSLRGVSSDLAALEHQFADLYPEDLTGLDAVRLAEQSAARTAQARRTAEDVARAAAALERLSQGRDARLAGALGASEAAQGQTAAIQSSTQVLAVLAEDLSVLRGVMLAQARLAAETTAREAAERAAAREARRRFWGGTTATPSTPAFDPFARARD